MFEFIYKPQDLDLLWHTFQPLRETGDAHQAAFLDYYEGGWQELFPSIGDACTLNGAQLGIHGEVWALPWQYRIETDTPQEICVRFSVRTVRTPYLLEKTLRIRQDDPALYLEEAVTNTGLTAQQFLWGHHPAFGAPFLDDSCELLMPVGTQILTREHAVGTLAAAQQSAYPHALRKDGAMQDVSWALPPEAEAYLEFALCAFKTGNYRLMNHRRALGFELSWDAAQFPYVWVWAPDNTMRYAPWYGRAYVFAVEPWSALPDNLETAAALGTATRIAPGQTIRTELCARMIEEKT